jgi:hypothetical protein
MVKSWVKENKKTDSEASLFNIIVDKIQAEYETTDLNHKLFIKKIRKELHQKNIDRAYVNGIMEAFESGFKDE